MGEKLLSTELNDCGVKTLDTNQLAVITNIKKGINKLSLISEETSIKQTFLKNIINNLVELGLIVMIPDPIEDTYMIKHNNKKTKTITLTGNLLLPVSSFTDSEGQRWVTRGAWHKIDNNVNVIDIDWVESEGSNTNDMMQTIMQRLATKNKKVSANVSSEYGKYKGNIVNLPNSVVHISKINKDVTTLVHSFTLDYNGVEFPWESNVPFVVSNDDMVSIVNTKTLGFSFTLFDMIQNCKKIIAFCDIDKNGILSFIDVYNKRGTYHIDIKKFNFNTKELIDVELGKKMNIDEVHKLLSEKATITNNFITQL